MGGRTRRERNDWKVLQCIKETGIEKPLNVRKLWRFLYNPTYQSAFRLWMDGYVIINHKLEVYAKPVYRPSAGDRRF